MLAGLLVPCLLFQGALTFDVVMGLLQPQNKISKGFALSEPWPTISAVSTVAKQSGLAVGDVLLQFDNQPFHGLTTINNGLATRQHGDSVSVTVQTKQGSEKSLRLRLENPNINADRWIRGAFVLLMAVVIPLFCLLMGFWVAFVRPSDPLAWIFWGLTVTFGHFLMLGDDVGIWAPGITLAMALFHTFLQSCFYLFIFLFGVYFPYEWEQSQRFVWLKWIFLGGLALIVAVNSASRLASFVTGAGNWAIRLDDLLNKPTIILTYASISIFFWALAEKRARSKDLDAKRRLRILFFGSLFALTPIGLLLVFALLSGKNLGAFPEWIWVPCILLLNLFPVTLAYVVVVHRAFDLHVVIRQGLQYGLMRGGVRFLIAILVPSAAGIATLQATQTGASPLYVYNIITAVIVFCILLVKGKDKVFSWIDRRFFREAYAV